MLNCLFTGNFVDVFLMGQGVRKRFTKFEGVRKWASAKKFSEGPPKKDRKIAKKTEK